eukprot:1215020-Pleurochrysis_carterae.AAC.1
MMMMMMSVRALLHRHPTRALRIAPTHALRTRHRQLIRRLRMRVCRKRGVRVRSTVNVHSSYVIDANVSMRAIVAGI